MSDNSSAPSRAASPGNDLSLPINHTARPFRFTWDPSSRRPGPGSVSEATEARGEYLTTTHFRPDVLNAAPINLAPGALPTEWSSSKHGFHAISTVLNNPHKRQAPPKAHSSLPVVPPTELPRVRRKDFDSYLRAISAEWDRFEKNRHVGQEAPAPADDQSTPRPSLSAEEPTATTRVQRFVSGKAIPDLETVPVIFFGSSFNLGDPHTFRVVTGQGDRTDEASDPSSLSHSLPLLEKLSHYADTVEQHLVREISLRSTSFFAALTNLHDLQSESEHCLERIAKLRSLLKDVDEKSAKRGLEVVRKESRLRNLVTVKESIKVVAGVMDMTGIVKGLVAAGQWGEALNVIEELERHCVADAVSPKSAQGISTQPLPVSLTRKGPLSPLPSLAEEHEMKPRKPPLTVHLLSLHAFSSLPNHLRTLTMEITSSLSLEMVNALKLDLLERINGRDCPPLPDSDNAQSLKDRLRPLLHGLVRTKGVREATLSWREVVMMEVQQVTLPYLSSPEQITGGFRPNNNAISDPGAVDRLRNMPHSEFLALLRPIYKTYLNAVTGLQCQGSIIMETLQAMPITPLFPDISALQQEINDILSSAAELSNTRSAKLLGARSEQNAMLELPEFLVLFNESWDFVVNCEVICRRMIVGLRGVVVSQAKTFLQAFHQTRISQSAKLVEDEQWTPCEVTPSIQHLADVLADAAVRDHEELLIVTSPGVSAEGTPVLAPPIANGVPSSSPARPSSPGGPAKPPAPAISSKHLRIEGKPYHVVSATAETLSLLLDYLRVVVNLPTLTMDTMSRMIEFLKGFNSRTCQVVLGAGAMRSAGLRNITAKHLALASQSLSIMIALIPYVREAFRRHLSATQGVILVEFDKLKRDYQEHQNEIHAKLIAIMGDRLSVHISNLQGIDWTSAKQGINDYMELLVKETVTLHKVLSRYLSTAVLEEVMTQVFAGINHRLSEEYGKIELPTPEAKTRLLADARYLHQKLSALKNVTAPSSMLETVVMEKGVARQDASGARSNTENVRGGGNVVQRSTGFMSSFKSPVLDKALPTPTAELGSPLNNGVGRKGDINGRVKARLSSLMSPPASFGSGVPDEVAVRDRDEAGLLDVPKNDGGLTGPAVGQVTGKAVSREPAGLSTQEDAVETRLQSPASSHVDGVVPHQST